jgi:hypothetical protein
MCPYRVCSNFPYAACDSRLSVQLPPHPMYLDDSLWSEAIETLPPISFLRYTSDERIHVCTYIQKQKRRNANLMRSLL